MSKQYLLSVLEETATRLWINNPTGRELADAIATGAISGTTNPSYCARLLKDEPEFIRPIIDEIAVVEKDDDVAADLIYQRATRRFMEGFFPSYDRSHGTAGFVTMQDDPAKDHDPDLIIKAAERHAAVGRNYMAKVPVVKSGIEAMAYLIKKGMPICATECFSIAQMTAMCEHYEAVCKECGQHPPFFITHITGIYDEEIQSYIEKEHIDIDPAIARQAGCIVARKEYRLIEARGYSTIMLGGGARHLGHFTEIAGGKAHVTLNWSTIDELAKVDGTTESRIHAQDSPAVIEELLAKLPDFRRAFEDEGYTPVEFDDIPALLRFRRMFLAGWADLKTAVATRRSEVCR